MKCGDLGIDIGVPGHIIDGSHGDPVLECSKECESDSGGVWQSCRQRLVLHSLEITLYEIDEDRLGPRKENRLQRIKKYHNKWKLYSGVFT